MFPPVQVTNQRPNRPKRPKYLPISQADNASTTGQLLNPVGSMYPVGINATPGGSNSFNGNYGAQGQFGAMLPTVNVGSQPTVNPGRNVMGGGNMSIPQSPNPGRNVMGGYNGVNGGGNTAQQPIQPQAPAQYNEGQSSPFTPIPMEQMSQIQNQYQVAQVTGNPNVLPPNLTAAQAYQSGFTNQPGFGQLYQFNTQTRSYELKPKTTADGTSTSQAGNVASNSDFANTKSQQYYAANNVNFYNQQRWDPARGQYRKIGDMIRTGDLDVSSPDGKPKKKKKGGGGGGDASRNQTPQGGNSPTTGSYNGNFNTATG